MQVTTAFETSIVNCWTKQMYATMEDIQSNWAGTLKADWDKYQTLANLSLPPADRNKALVARVSLNSEIKQVLAIIFVKIAEEIGNIQISEAMNITDIVDLANVANASNYLDFAVRLDSRYHDQFGPVLSCFTDPKATPDAQLQKLAPMYASKLTIVKKITAAFDGLLKSLAWIYGHQVWYAICKKAKLSIGVDQIIATLAAEGMPQEMIDEIYSNIRVKPPTAKKPSAEKTAAPQQNAAAPQQNAADDSQQNTDDESHSEETAAITEDQLKIMVDL